MLRTFLLAVAAALTASCSVPGEPGPVPPAEAAGMHRGMVLGLFSRDEPSFIDSSLREIRALGATSISIVIPWVTPGVRSTRIFPRADMTPGDDALRMTIRRAHRLGMSVMLMPIIHVDEAGEGEWRGTLDPPDWAEWFRSYRGLLERYARLAEEEHVSLLSVGSELCSTEARIGDWVALIGHLRALYGGRLTYSWNWDHRDSSGFAGALDAVGMNAYFELSPDPDAGVASLVRAWEPIVAEVRSWQARAGRPLILTEVGYPSRRGAARNPWDYTAGGEPDPEAQARAYRAFLEAWVGVPELGGVYFYLWWGEGGPADTGYTPRGKPAEDVLRGWLGRAGPGDER